MPRLLTWLGLAGFFLGWNAPNHYPPWTSFHLELAAAMGLCLIGAGLLIRFERPAPDALRLMPSPAVWVWCLAGAWPTLQYVAGTLSFRGDAVLAWLYGAGAACAIYLGQLWAARDGAPQAARAVLITLVVAGLVAAGLTWVQWLRLDTPSWWAMDLIDARPFANFAQANHLGLAMVWSIVAVTGLFELRAVAHRGVWAAAVAFFGIALLMSQSRAAALALVVVAGLWWCTRRRVPTRLRRRDLLVATVVALLLAAAVEPAQQALLLKGVELRASADAGPRLLIWRHFAAALFEHPWAGYGFNQSVAALAAVADRVEPSRNVIYAHNWLLDLMTWGGVPVGLLLAGALLAWLVGWLRRGHDAPATQALRYLVLGLWLALLVQSSLEYPYAHTYFLLPAALLAGLVTPMRAAAAASQTGAAAVRPSRAMVVISVLTAALLVGFVRDYLTQESDFRHNRFVRAQFGAAAGSFEFHDAWFTDQLAALNASAALAPRVGMSSDEIERLRVLARRFHIVANRLEYAKALALNGHLAEAEGEMQVIRSVMAPQIFAPTDRYWRSWLIEQGLAAPAAAAASAPD